MTRDNRLYIQGDILLEPVDMPQPRAREKSGAKGAVVLAHGEATGHSHTIRRGAVMFRDDALARDIPAGLYIAHVEITEDTAVLQHEEHDPITLPRGTYRVRRQREFRGEVARVVTD